jgi:hypothetical protein
MTTMTKPYTKSARANAKLQHGKLSEQAEVATARAGRGRPVEHRPTDCQLPELVKPDGPGYMPLYCAAQWIVTHGGTREIDRSDEVLWRDAYKELLDRIASEDVKVFGVRDGATESVSGIHFASCLVNYPFSDPRLDLVLSEELCLFSRPYLDDDHWRIGGY